MSRSKVEQQIGNIPSDFYIANGITSLRLFGSHLHGNPTALSDIDLLIEFEPGRHVGYFELSRIQLDLSDILSRTVDLRTPAELSKRFRGQVVSEASTLYERR